MNNMKKLEENLNLSAKTRPDVNTLPLGFDVIRSKIAEAALSANDEIYDVTVTLPATNFSVADSEVAKINTYTSDVATTTR